jgi:hypothetical protein
MIPQNVTDALTSLQSQVTAAAPLTAASQPTITAIKLNSQALVTTVDTALAGAAGQLDTWQAPTDVDQIIAGVLALTTAATDQANLAVMRGLVGRVASNVDQLP